MCCLLASVIGKCRAVFERWRNLARTRKPSHLHAETSGCALEISQLAGIRSRYRDNSLHTAIVSKRLLVDFCRNKSLDSAATTVFEETAMWLTIATELREPATAIMRLEGRVVLGRDSQQLEWSIDKQLKDGSKVVVLDLAGVTHIDSTGVGILVMLAGKAKTSGAELRLAGAAGTVHEVFTLTKLNELIPLFASAEDAASAAVRAHSA